MFGLTEPAPLWTEAAYDRCLLLALLYPIAVIVILCVATGNVGPAEHAWYLYGDIPPIRRIAIIPPFVVAACLAKPLLFVERRCSRRVTFLALLAAFATLAVAFGLALAAVGSVAFAIVGAVVVAIIGLIAGTGAGAVAGTIAFAGAVGFAYSIPAAFHLSAAGAIASCMFCVFPFAAGVARAA